MNEEQYICICGKSFQTKKSLGHHKTHCKCFQQQKKEKQLEQLKARQLPNGMFKCENCGKEHDGSYCSGRFCSDHCRRTYSTRKGNLTRKFYPTPWNKGKHVKGHPHSKETREKLSEIRSKQLDTCKAGFQDVGWYKVKNLNGVEYTVRGHWEQNVANKLTKDNILWIKNHTLKYITEDGVKRIYNPDFYLPLTNEFIEVKGYYSDKDKIKMQLVLEQNDVKIYFIDQYHYQDFIDGKINLSELFMK